MIIRTYGCTDCGLEWEVECESSAGDPDCPQCSQVLQWIPARVNIATHKSKAIDVTQQIIESDFGLTNLNDSNREGDVAYKPPPVMHTAEKENIEQAVREYVRETTANLPTPKIQSAQAQAGSVDMNFWGGSGGNPSTVAAQPIPMQMALAAAKQGPEANVNPLQMLQDGIKSGHIGTKARIMARWRP